MARVEYCPAWRKEVGAWLNNPHTSSMSDAIKAHAAKNKHIPKRREAKMCQACGAVSIIGGERLKQVGENVHGAFYCDRECAETDRGRVYRTSESYQAKVSASYADRGLRRHWETQVCDVLFPECTICGKRFVGNNINSKICSVTCQKERSRRDAWIRHRKTQTPREVRCVGCGVPFTALTRTRCETMFWCGDTCQMRHHRRQVKHTRRERQRVPDGVSRGDVSLHAQHRKHKGKCQICGCKVVMADSHREDMATVDHIVPLSKGGLHVEDNVQLACWKCNTKKSDTITSGRQRLLY